MRLRSFIATGLCAPALVACATFFDFDADATARGRVIYATECAQCHGALGEGGGQASLGLGVVPPDLIRLAQRNDGVFPREFVRRFAMGLAEKTDPFSPMPDFATTGLRHVYPDGGADGEVLEGDFEDLLDYLASIQA